MKTCCDHDLLATRDWLSAFNRISWRRALAGLGRRTSGLHRYRELRARALADALEGENGGHARRRRD